MTTPGVTQRSEARRGSVMHSPRVCARAWPSASRGSGADGAGILRVWMGYRQSEAEAGQGERPGDAVHLEVLAAFELGHGGGSLRPVLAVDHQLAGVGREPG